MNEIMFHNYINKTFPKPVNKSLVYFLFSFFKVDQNDKKPINKHCVNQYRFYVLSQTTQ